MYESEHPIINVTVDVVIDFLETDEQDMLKSKLVLIQRGNDPFKGKLALPGGFVNPDESTEDAAVREVKEETGLDIRPGQLQLLKVMSEPGRDPRGPTISVVYQCSIWDNKQIPVAGDDAAAIKLIDDIDACDNPEWFAFDHWDILFS